MAIGGKIKITGGQKLAKYLQDMKRQNERLRDTKAEAGFFGPRIASLALVHELGRRDDGVRLPARPAFGASRQPAREEFRRAMRQEVEGKRGVITREALEAATLKALEAVKESYRSAPGPPVGPAQAARKKGTPGQDKLLVGTRGPRLIEHLEARIDGVKISE